MRGGRRDVLCNCLLRVFVWLSPDGLWVRFGSLKPRELLDVGLPRGLLDVGLLCGLLDVGLSSATVDCNSIYYIL